MAVADLRDELNCSICLNVYEDPVMLRCGHNFCSTCIGKVLTAQEGSGMYSCPQCRMQFEERPALQRNLVLRNIAERFRSTHAEEEPSGVLCTYCINSLTPAVKTCVNCEASLCEGHVKVHNKSSEHVLIEPTTCLENRKCSKHKKILEYFCYEDSVCICVSCRLDGIHKGHQVEPIEEAFEKKREKWRNVLEELPSQKDEATSRIQTLLSNKDKMIRNAASTKEKVMDMVKEIKKKLDALEERILNEVYKQEEETSNSITKLIQNLEVNIDSISEKITMFEKMYSMADPLRVLQDHGVDRDNEAKDCKVLEKTQRKDDGINDFPERMIYVQLFKSLFNIVNEVRADTLQTDLDLILDEDTAGNNVNISKDLKTLSWAEIQNSLPRTPKRFSINQVLSKNSFSSGQHYWEMETSKTGNWRVGVAYASMDTKDRSSFGDNKKSWCLRRSNDKYSVLHDKTETGFAQTSSSHNVGVYLDYEDGRLSFYELCGSVRHMHTFHTTFTEPLHAAVLVYKSFVKIMNMAH
ncbi:PREDICTED: nuclear factor 7, ovary-like [Nanorana parkeri]|uniref:nuclear factor 7, ovary-like n=1 Tax=Nanorana parkeri TaxID=125878 RepID=UPI000854DBFD|nr:PREDICTED: nuclear factor 7, ovary-like [Nanorana parkeri]